MTLKEELTTLRSRSEAARPPAVVEKMHRMVEDLRRAGAADRVLKVGTKAPDFVLPNANGELIQSKSLIARGPLVVNFYRGRW